MSEARDLHERPAELLQRLLRFDTTNPPGNERECIEWIAACSQDVGLRGARSSRRSPRARTWSRASRAAGEAPPLLLQGHVDVVAARGPVAARTPFAGEIADGYVWGRGALDMKGGVAMMLAAFLRAQARRRAAAGRRDPLRCWRDEEAGSDIRRRRTSCASTPSCSPACATRSASSAASRMDLAGRRFYPIMVAEKQVCWMRATFRGPAGHGSHADPRRRDGAPGAAARARSTAAACRCM